MSYTPVELRHVRVGRRPFGYDRTSVEQILADVADSFETVWRDRGELADKVEALEVQLEELKRREQVLTNTLVAAERAAEEVRERAKREAELMLAEAHAEARSIMRNGQGERERLFAETRRVEALLRSALGLVEEVGEPESLVTADEPAAAAPAPAATPAPEPSREDTGELRRLSAAPAAEPLAPPVAPAEPAAEETVPAPEEEPGWPPLRRVAGRSSHFDWGD
jgi:cell division initiation protein